MFPSSGLFAGIDCPFSKRGLCERPHCLYRHATEIPDVVDAARKSPLIDLAGLQSGCPESGTPASHQTQDVCLRELERINKEIETVRHEVEQEQRRLSYYQTGQAEGRNSPSKLPSSKSERRGKNSDRGSYGPPLSADATNMYFQAGKYVLDNSKPRTDLEYDPLSNFSAGLRPCMSQKIRNGQGLKRARNTEPDNTKTVTCKARPPRSPSPEPHDDLTEDGVLIIDIPPSPDKKRGQDQKPLDSVADRSVRGKKFNEVEKVPHSPPHLAETGVSKATHLPVSGNVEENKITNKYAENKSQFIFFENTKCENIPADGSVEPGGEESGPLKAAEKEAKSPDCATASVFTELLVEKEENPFQDKLHQCAMPHRVETMNPLQPYHFSPKNSLFYKAPVANLDSQCVQQREPPVQDRADYYFCSTKAPSMLPHSQTTLDKPAGGMQGVAADSKAPPKSCLEVTDLVSGCKQNLAADKQSTAAFTSTSSSNKQVSDNKHDKIIVIDSSSDDDDDDNDDDDDEPNYSELDLSDSDPMEECYRIFMEENELPQTSVPAMDVEKPEVNIKPQEVPGKKRVAHEVKHTEPVAKSRPQPQVLVPLRMTAVSGSTSQPSVTSKIPQVHQRASMLTAPIKGAQTFVSSATQRKTEADRASPSAQTSKSLQPAPAQNAYVNCIPVGTAVIEVGNNLHLILSKGAFPVSASSSAVTSVLTPIGPVLTSTGPVKENYHLPAVNTAQRCRTAAAVLIPAPARKPALTSAFSSAHSTLASTATTTTPAIQTAVKQGSTKRKLKQQCEAAKEKVPHNVRQRYVNMFTEEFLKTTANVNDAFEKALAEERSVYNRSVNKLKYLSIAVNALKRLKNQSTVTAKDNSECNSQRQRGNIPLNLKCKENAGDVALYESLKGYVLTEERLIESNYPVQHPEKPGCAVLFADNKRGSTDVLKRICCRCGATYSVSQTGKHIRKEECNYHYGKGVTKRVPGGVETRYSCCEGVMGAPGCQVFKLHVHDSLSLDGFVQTVLRHPSDTSCPGVYSLDCEMCYTIQGLELSRVTLVDSSLQVVYDTFIRPDNEVIDYNTRFSGISEEDVKGNHTSLRKVQETLLSFINADTILIGHSLETDLCALKLLHGTVVDTSVVFPHRLGPPHKLTLNNLTAEYLRRIIQESVCGHDTAEDATACMELMLWKVKEDGKLKNSGTKT